MKFVQGCCCPFVSFSPPHCIACPPLVFALFRAFPSFPGRLLVRARERPDGEREKYTGTEKREKNEARPASEGEECECA